MTLLKFLRHRVIKNDCDLVRNNPWAYNLANNIRDEAVREAIVSYEVCVEKKKNKLIDNFKFIFVQKKCKSESISIQKEAVDTSQHNIITIRWPSPRIKPMKPPTVMKFFIPNGVSNKLQINHNCRLQRTNLNEYYLCIPIQVDSKMVDNQDRSKKKKDSSLRICALDPGVRTFQTIYDATQNQVTFVGEKDINRIARLSYRYGKEHRGRGGRGRSY